MSTVDLLLSGMAARRKTRSSGNRVIRKQRIAKAEIIETPVLANSTQGRLFSKQVLIGALVVALTLLVVYKKHWFIAATVNGMPILSPQVMARLYTDYRLPAVNELIDERVIMAEARKRNALPTQEETDARVVEFEQQIGGPENLNNLLSQEGMSRASLMRRLKMRLALEKIYSNEASVSAQEVDDFIKTNKAQLTATESAEQRVEAEEIIRQNKLGTIINEKFTELRQKAIIKVF